MSRLKLSEISVVIPYYRQKETLLSIINNLLNSGFKEPQILIVDDYSNDQVVETITSKYKYIKYVKNKTNLGAAYSRNAGIINTKSKYILFIDSDLSFKPRDLLNLLVDTLNYDIIFPKKIFEDGSLLSPANIWEANYCMASGIFLIKRQSLSKLDEFFDENYFLYGEDSDFFLRCKAFGLKFKYVPGSIFKHPKKIFYSEKVYYFRTRNVIYFALKFTGIIRYRVPLTIYLFCFTFLNFLMALLNKHINFPPLRFQKESSYSQKCFARLRLLFLFFKAILWNVKNLPVIVEKRRKLKKSLKR